MFGRALNFGSDQLSYVATINLSMFLFSFIKGRVAKSIMVFCYQNNKSWSFLDFRVVWGGLAEKALGLLFVVFFVLKYALKLEAELKATSLRIQNETDTLYAF